VFNMTDLHVGIIARTRGQHNKQNADSQPHRRSVTHRTIMRNLSKPWAENTGTATTFPYSSRSCETGVRKCSSCPGCSVVPKEAAEDFESLGAMRIRWQENTVAAAAFASPQRAALRLGNVAAVTESYNCSVKFLVDNALSQLFFAN
jgi:hypothetical protein